MSALLLLTSLGCKENLLQVGNEEICLNYEGNSSCQKAKDGAYLLQLKDGKPELQVLDERPWAKDAKLPQYAAASPMALGPMALTVENGKIVVTNSGTRVVDESGKGLLITRMDGQYAIATQDPKFNLEQLEVKPLIVGRAKPGRYFLSAAERGMYVMNLIDIVFDIDDEGTHYVPNDTGTAVIITDNFRFIGTCSAVAPSECCASYDPALPPLDYTPWVDDYAAEGQRLLACFPNGSICTFLSGIKLIVIDCANNKRYCLDRTDCPVTITTTDEQGICISVPTECSIENPFEN